MLYASFFVKLLVADAVDGMLAFDCEAAAFVRHEQLAETRMDICQIASRNYVLILQMNQRRLEYRALISAVAESCVLVGFGVAQDAKYFLRTGVRARLRDCRALLGDVRGVGLYKWVKTYLNRILSYKDKAVTCSDWSVLTLSDVQMYYAICDVTSVIDVICRTDFISTALTAQQPIEVVMGSSNPYALPSDSDKSACSIDGADCELSAV